jgi:hypothetical protein
MASSSDDKERMPLEDDRQDLEPKEEAVSEAEEEEQRSCPCSVIASIGVVKLMDEHRRGCAAPHLSSTDISTRQQPLPYSNT